MGGEPQGQDNGGQVLALITARGGSKGLPRKNLLPLAGRPLIAWSIKAASEAACRPRVVVSTDDEEIAQAAREWGAEVPFLRPAALAQDDSPHIDVILHAVAWLEQNQGYRPKWVLLLQPTSPLRLARDIDDALALARTRGADSVVGVQEAPSHPYLMHTLDQEGRLRPFLPTPPGYQRRQDFPDLYALNGAIYLVSRRMLLAKSSLLDQGTLALVMPPERSLDVDTAWDLRLARLVLEEKHGRA
ncbi:MAG: acylneuraminate cytidylyltransferase family protein [Desulfarculus sp.]|nr:acylneuraminate cytidylyltransferase family protein [Desulfarculus sp.]